MSKLYHYIHCPYCVRVRMALGFLGISYKSIVLSYDDENTPLSLMGKKMLPIFEFEDGSLSNESLDIIKVVDKEDKLTFSNFSSNQSDLNQLISKLGSSIHPLCMPYWIYTYEFNDQSREYFQKKKEKSKGPFKKLVENREKYLAVLNQDLSLLENELSPFYRSESLSINDILIASHLWGMFIYPEFRFSEKIHSYLMKIKEYANFEYHEDFWK